MAIAGITNGSGDVTVVVVEATDNDFELLSDEKIALQKGDRAAAYAELFRRTKSYLESLEDIEAVCMKASSVPRSGVKKGHFEAAEVRGVVMAAASAAGTNLVMVNKATLSRRIGTRNVDDYLKDESFWGERRLSTEVLRKGSREAAILAIDYAEQQNA